MKARGETDHAGVPKPKKRPGRVPVSCAECRRLKLRCDRKQPCENCTKRGCASICPEGSLTPGRGNRLILTSTEELHEQVDTLSSRVRELEEALRALQASVSVQQHPLLSGDHPLARRSQSQNRALLSPPPPSQPRLAEDSAYDSSLSPSPEATYVFDTTWQSLIEQLGF